MNRRFNMLFAVGALSLTLVGVASAQDTAAAPTAAQFNALNDSYMKTKAVVDKMSKVVISGYIQAQLQVADSLRAAAPVDGGQFGVGAADPAQTDKRFQIRRSRLKATYNGTDVKYVFEIDAVPQSGFSIKDAYVQLTDPWVHSVSLTVGNMDQPYGFEIAYSSAAMEYAERSRMEQSIFHNEKELGAKIELNPGTDMGFAQYLNLKAGLFNGTEGGQNGATGDAVDNKFDFIGRLGFKAPMPDMGFEVDGGVSTLQGKTQNANAAAFTTVSDSMVKTAGDQDSVWFKRTAIGGDLEVTYKIPVIGNLQLRGEYSTGKAPTTATATTPYANSVSPLVERNFEGWYVAWIQNFTPMFQTVVRYDEYDPNTDVSGSAISTAKGFTTADIKYDDLGLGLNYYYNANLKFLAYADIPTNETTKIAGYTNSDDGNVYTLRMQVKF